MEEMTTRVTIQLSETDRQRIDELTLAVTNLEKAFEVPLPTEVRMHPEDMNKLRRSMAAIFRREYRTSLDELALEETSSDGAEGADGPAPAPPPETPAEGDTGALADQGGVTVLPPDQQRTGLDDGPRLPRSVTTRLPGMERRRTAPSGEYVIAEEMAELLNCGVSTLHRWAIKHPELKRETMEIGSLRYFHQKRAPAAIHRMIKRGTVRRPRKWANNANS